jgi:hypothetical protein
MLVGVLRGDVGLTSNNPAPAGALAERPDPEGGLLACERTKS